jgi:hypothetical protein
VQKISGQIGAERGSLAPSCGTVFGRQPDETHIGRVKGLDTNDLHRFPSTSLVPHVYRTVSEPGMEAPDVLEG